MGQSGDSAQTKRGWGIRNALRLAGILGQALVSAGGAASGVAILLMAFVATREAAGRYLFGAPWIHSLDVSVYLMVFMTCTGLAYTMREGGHVRIRLVFDRFPHKLQAITSFGASVVGLVLSAMLTYQGVLLVQWSHKIGKTSLSMLDIPLYIPQIMIPLGFFVLWIQLIFEVIKHTKGLLVKRTPTGTDGR